MVRAVPDLRQRPAAAGAAAGRPAHASDRGHRVGLQALDWYAASAISTGDFVRLVGNRWRYPPAADDRPRPRGREGDEQPLDAAALTEALILAHEITGDERYAESARRAFAWFLGRNRLGVAGVRRADRWLPRRAGADQPSITTRAPSRHSPSSRPIWRPLRRCPSASPSPAPCGAVSPQRHAARSRRCDGRRKRRLVWPDDDGPAGASSALHPPSRQSAADPGAMAVPDQRRAQRRRRGGRRQHRVALPGRGPARHQPSRGGPVERRDLQLGGGRRSRCWSRIRPLRTRSGDWRIRG